MLVKTAKKNFSMKFPISRKLWYYKNIFLWIFFWFFVFDSQIVLVYEFLN